MSNGANSDKWESVLIVTREMAEMSDGDREECWCGDKPAHTGWLKCMEKRAAELRAEPTP